jgi:hypothetical protein
MKIVIENDLDEAIELAVRLAGFKRAGKGNCAGAIRAIARGTHRIVKSEDSVEAQKWILLCDGLIKEQATFTLTYKDSQGKCHSLIAIYAEIAIHNDRYYLDVLTIDSYQEEGSLALNRSIRFDLIVDIMPVVSTWEEQGLNSVIADFELYRSSSLDYRRHSDDVKVTSTKFGIAVSRKISDLNWFIRSMLSYSPDVVIISPEESRISLQDIYRKSLSQGFCS